MNEYARGRAELESREPVEAAPIAEPEPPPPPAPCARCAERDAEIVAASVEPAPSAEAPKRRGRKPREEITTEITEPAPAAAPAATAEAPKRRGRKPRADDTQQCLLFGGGEPSEQHADAP
jgi:hypothetical protein